jgi:hypothetical protein
VNDTAILRLSTHCFFARPAAERRGRVSHACDDPCTHRGPATIAPRDGGQLFSFRRTRQIRAPAMIARIGKMPIS